MEDFSLKNRKMNASVVRHEFLDMQGNIVADRVQIIPTTRGTYFISEQDRQRVGKIEYHNNKVKFFVKTVKFGSPGEILADPVNSTILPAYGDTDSRSRTYEYTIVSKETFDIYVKYLYTKNSNYFQNVARRLNDGEA